MPRCTILSNALPPEREESALFANAVPVASDWFGAPLPFSLSFAFALSPAALYFGASIRSATSSRPGTGSGQFADRLWEHDVFELFLASDNGTGYQEFNLAPNGAWWTEAFESYRKPGHRSTPFDPPNSIGARAENGETRVWMSYPRAGLAVPFSGGARSHANLCAILGKDNRTYVSYHHPTAQKPDFHLDACFGALEIVRRDS